MSIPRNTSAIMRKVRSKNTAPEILFRKALWAKGIRYKANATNLPGKPDIVLPTRKTAIFVDGDFWHGGQWLRRRLMALEDQFQQTMSKDYWVNKIRRNMRRDCTVTSQLMSQGWTVLRFWESDIRNDLEGCVAMTLRILKNGVRPNSFSAAPQKTFAEFFAGIGLVRMGLERQGWTLAFANDLDEQKKEMYEAHFGDTEQHFTLGDIHKLSASQIPTVTLATASFPCNDLSLAGAREGLKGKESSAFWGFVRLLSEMKERKPPLVLLENVTGFLTSRGGSDFREALLALNHLGYCVDAFILDAARFVPQSRQRLFVIGMTQNQFGRCSESQPQHFYNQDLRPKALANFILSHPEICWNLQLLPAPPGSLTKLEEILEDLPHTAPQWWDIDRAEYLLNQMSERHRATAERMIASPCWSYGTVFRRIRNGKSMAELRTDGIAGCLRTPRGGSGRQILFKAGKGEYFVRLLTPRECARLMGADDYKLTVPLNQALFGFGDAVCVPAIEWIAEYYLNPMVNELIRGRALATTN
ncbi:MAG: DNA mismatch endonuclease Vsr [Acidobacteria bacterium]|nr:DNA mismatch endonuclease Vsr [Acidobacteriota bacterium]